MMLFSIRVVPIAIVVLCCYLSLAQTSAFAGQKWSTTTKSSSFHLYSKLNDDNSDILSRRSTLGNMLGLGYFTLSFAAIAKPSLSRADDDDLTRGGVKLTPFNGLAFNYKGTDSQGLDASTLDEPSIPYIKFLEELDKGNVKFVEFYAPAGNRAYVTFKAIEGVAPESPPIRIGEGYPIEDPRGFSSPAFVVKAVQRNGVPYKFTLPALANYK